MKLQTQCIGSVKRQSLGVYRATDAVPAPGEADFDILGPWVLNNIDTHGVDMSGIFARVGVGDSLQLLTGTGSADAVVLAVTIGADTTSITFDPAPTGTGSIELGDATAVWFLPV